MPASRATRRVVDLIGKRCGRCCGSTCRLGQAWRFSLKTKSKVYKKDHETLAALATWQKTASLVTFFGMVVVKTRPFQSMELYFVTKTQLTWGIKLGHCCC